MGNGRYHTHREMADGKPLCAAKIVSDGRDFMAGIQSYWWEGNSSSHTLVDKDPLQPCGAH